MSLPAGFSLFDGLSSVPPGKLSLTRFSGLTGTEEDISGEQTRTKFGMDEMERMKDCQRLKSDRRQKRLRSGVD